MTRLVMEQFKKVLDSYAARDIGAALAVRNGDLQIDTLNNALFYETFVYMGEDPHRIATCTQILFCVKNLQFITLSLATCRRASARKQITRD